MIEMAYYTSPLGPIEITASEAGLRQIKFVDEILAGDESSGPLITECITQLKEYFDGERKRFSLKLDLKEFSSFHREVFRLVQSIPYGRTRTYSDIAITMGKPGASRAVGQANGHNPLPIIIPCHRVIGKEGDLRGYAFGLDIKRALLEMENPVKFQQQALLF